MDSLNYHALSLTEQAREVLKGELSVMVTPIKTRQKLATAKPQTEWLRTEARRTFMANPTRAWRIQQAQALNVPLYGVTRTALQSIVQTSTTNAGRFGADLWFKVRRKAQKYGADIVAICTEHSRLGRRALSTT